ncbi:hypothetical protein Tco_1374213 [Tanacetum coccineum]
MQTMADLTADEKKQIECDIKAANIIFQGLPNDIYTLSNHMKTTNTIWFRVKALMEGTKLTKQERETNLADEFEKFTYEKGETIQSYYLRFFKLMRFKQSKNLHDVSYNQLRAYLKKNHDDENEIRAEHAIKNHDPPTLVEKSHNPPSTYNNPPPNSNQVSHAQQYSYVALVVQ